MFFIIKKINFETAFPLWKNYLWAERKDAIRPMSSMTLDGDIDMSIYERYVPTFLGLFHQKDLIGVLSGHLSSPDKYRVRGLFIHEKYRGHGGSQLLFREFQKIAASDGAQLMWSYPRLPAFAIYQKFGFQVYPSAKNDETHVYAFMPLKV